MGNQKNAADVPNKQTMKAILDVIDIITGKKKRPKDYSSMIALANEVSKKAS